MNALKWILIAFAIGLLVGAGIVLVALYRPASSTIAELREQYERDSAVYRRALHGNIGLLEGARGRAEAAEDLAGRVQAEVERLKERARHNEQRFTELADRFGEIEAGNLRAEELNRWIAEEAARGLEEIRGLGENLPGDSGDGPERAPPAED
jgi:hypothetical protein